MIEINKKNIEVLLFLRGQKLNQIGLRKLKRRTRPIKNRDNTYQFNSQITWKTNKCDVLHDLIPIVQFKKREKHPWRSGTFSKVAG